MWEEIEPRYEFQVRTWIDREEEVVLSVEQNPAAAPWDRHPNYQAVLLPVDYGENPSVEKKLATRVGIDEAERVAQVYRERTGGE